MCPTAGAENWPPTRTCYGGKIWLELAATVIVPAFEHRQWIDNWGAVLSFQEFWVRFETKQKNKQSKLLKAGVVKAVTIESETWPAMFDIWRKCVAGKKKNKRSYTSRRN